MTFFTKKINIEKFISIVYKVLKANNKDFKYLFGDIICKNVAHVLKEAEDIIKSINLRIIKKLLL